MKNDYVSVEMEYSDRVLHDPIHGTITLTKTAWKIIDTEEFQRLRQIRQNGSVCFVYPGAEHTRFQHCIGVAYLCLIFGERIQSKYPTAITPHEIELLCIAGLVHDLGHGPGSHLYDGSVVPAFDGKAGRDTGFTHEEASLLILRRICDSYKINLSSDDLNTIGKMIFGCAEKTPSNISLNWASHTPDKDFLFEIVSNARTGIDVDKFDYLRRDSHYCGVACSFDPQRLMAFFYIVDGHIQYHEKANELIIAMWRARDDLHRRVYQHRVVKCIDQMLLHAILLAGDTPLPSGVGALSEAHLNLNSYCGLTDSSLECLLKTNPASAAILKRIYRRELWPTILTVVSGTAIQFPSLATTPGVVCGIAHFEGEYRYHFYLITPTLPENFYECITKDVAGTEVTFLQRHS